jgi:hypothetical protein
LRSSAGVDFVEVFDVGLVRLHGGLVAGLPIIPLALKAPDFGFQVDYDAFRQIKGNGEWIGWIGHVCVSFSIEGNSVAH